MARIAAEYDVEPATVRQWATRGHITACGKVGSRNVYDPVQVRLSRPERDIWRNYPMISRLGAKYADRLIDSREAAILADVKSAATIRAWVARGHLRSVATDGSRKLFRVRDVAAAAMRNVDVRSQ